MALPPSSQEQELALLLATGQGASPQVVAALVTAYGADLMKLVRILSAGSSAEIDDPAVVLPSMISQAIKNSHSIERYNSVRAWIFSAAINSWEAMYRRGHRKQWLKQWFKTRLPRTESHLHPTFESIDEEELNRYFDRLGGKARQTIILRYGLLMPVSLISEILQITEQETLKNLRTARRPLLPRPEGTTTHSQRAAHNMQAEIQAAFDRSPDLRSDPALEAHMNNCGDCKDFYLKLSILDQRISAHLRSRWPASPLPTPGTDELTSRTLALIQDDKMITPKPWPLKEMAGVVLMIVLVLTIFRFLTPAVVDYTPTPTAALLPSQMLEVRPTSGSPAAEAPEIAYSLAKTLIGGTTFVNTITYSPDGDLLVSGSTDTQVRVWGGPDESNLVVLRGHMSQVTSLGFSPDGSFLASGDEEGFIRIWDPLERFQFSSLDNSPGPIRSLEFSPDGKLLAVGTAESLWLWVVNRQAFVRVFEYPGADITSISFSPFGDMLALADEQTVYLRRVRDGQLLLKYENHTDLVNQVAFSPDGNRLASASKDQTVNIVQINPASDGSVEAEIVHMLTLDSEVTDVAFSKDGTLLAVTTVQGGLGIYYVSNGNLAQEITDGGQFVAFSPVLNTMASIGTDGLIRIWE
jgi:DNA-directed RNA polymerase specialized sigma24 family protein